MSLSVFTDERAKRHTYTSTHSSGGYAVRFFCSLPLLGRENEDNCTLAGWPFDDLSLKKIRLYNTDSYVRQPVNACERSPVAILRLFCDPNFNKRCNIAGSVVISKGFHPKPPTMKFSAAIVTILSAASVASGFVATPRQCECFCLFSHLSCSIMR